MNFCISRGHIVELKLKKKDKTMQQKIGAAFNFVEILELGGKNLLETFASLGAREESEDELICILLQVAETIEQIHKGLSNTLFIHENSSLYKKHLQSRISIKKKE